MAQQQLSTNSSNDFCIIMTNKKVKRSITRENLEYHGIYYDDTGSGTLPAHVCVVRDMLLFFEHIVPDGGWKETLLEEESEADPNKIDLKNVWDEARHPPNTAWIPRKHHEADLNIKSPRWQAAYDNMVDCSQVAREAQLRARDAENGWMLFWSTNTFKRVSQRDCDQPGFQ
jgi:hypothetical protein